MDKQKYGESIVNQIIDAYKNTQEFKNDAIEFVKKEIINEIHAQNAKSYYKFLNNGGEITNQSTEELCDSVDITKKRIEYLNELFELTFGEGEHARP